MTELKRRLSLQFRIGLFLIVAGICGSVLGIALSFTYLTVPVVTLLTLSDWLAIYLVHSSPQIAVATQVGLITLWFVPLTLLILFSGPLVRLWQRSNS